jgi:hypothetical protein
MPKQDNCLPREIAPYIGAGIRLDQRLGVTGEWLCRRRWRCFALIDDFLCLILLIRMMRNKDWEINIKRELN